MARRRLRIDVGRKWKYPDVNVYEVTDSEEEGLLLEALEGDNPILSDSEIDKIFGPTKQTK